MPHKLKLYTRITIDGPTDTSCINLYLLDSYWIGIGLGLDWNWLGIGLGLDGKWIRMGLGLD